MPGAMLRLASLATWLSTHSSKARKTGAVVGNGFAQRSCITQRLSSWRCDLTVLSFLVGVSTSAGGCGSDETRVDSGPAVAFTAQEQAVYAVILAQNFGSTSYVLLDPSADLNWPADEVAQETYDISKELGGLSADTLGNLWSANPRAQSLPADLALGAPYSLLDRATLAKLVERDSRDWTGFFSQFPGAPGVLDIAHVGFDTSGSQALAYLWWQAGGLAAWRRYFLLQRNGDTWSIIDDVITLIS